MAQYYPTVFNPNMVNRVRQLPYIKCIYIPTFIGVHMILDMSTLTCTLIFSPCFFKAFKIFLVLIILYGVKTYCYIFDFIWLWIYLFGLGRERFFTVYICFTESIFSNSLYKWITKYFSLLQSTCQFRVSIKNDLK